MKTLGIVVLILLVGCAGRPTIEQLEAEASTTGDWTEVEQRERMMERIRVKTESECKEGYYYYCRVKGAQEICSCEPTRHAGFYE